MLILEKKISRYDQLQKVQESRKTIAQVAQNLGLSARFEIIIVILDLLLFAKIYLKKQGPSLSEYSLKWHL